MKKITTYLLIFILVFSTLTMTACGPTDEETMEDALDTRYSEIMQMLETVDSNKDITYHLLSWANTRDIRVSYDSYDNVIMSSKATEGYENAESNIFQCTVDLNNPEQTATSIAVASYIITNPQNHGFVRVIFNTPGNLPKLSRTYLTADNFISLDWGIKNSILVGSAGTDHYTISSRLKWTRPSYTDAYQITIEGLPETDFRESQNSPNPITIIGDILAQAKSNSILLEIANLNAGTSTDLFPTSATCTILVNQKDANNVKKRVQSAMDDFCNKYNVDPETFTFTYSEVETPAWVISYEDTARIISFLYTCPDGNYLKDDAGEVIAKANIGFFHTDNIGFTAKVAAASKSTDVLDEMESIFETVCGLSEISYHKESDDPVWESNIAKSDDYYSESDVLDDKTEAEYNSLVKALITASEDAIGRTPDTSRTLEHHACADVAERIRNMNIVGFGVTKERLLEDTEIIMQYLENGNKLE